LSLINTFIAVDYIFLQKQETENNELGPPVVIADPNFDLGMQEREGGRKVGTG
jgi:hypothetical protein